MTEGSIELLDVVALTVDLPERNLQRGQVGTVVEQLGDSAFEIEFTDEDGRTVATAPINADALLPLRYAPASINGSNARP